MGFQLEGTVKKVGLKTEGTSKAGKEWKKIDFVVDFMDGQYEKMASLECMGASVDHAEKLKVGETVKVEFNIDCREWEGKYYTNLKCWKVEKVGEAAPKESGTSQPASASSTPGNNSTAENPDLPF
jgi:hypothetical protein